MLARCVVGISLIGALAASGCGYDGPSEDEVRGALASLPYSYEYRDIPYSGAGFVLAGTVTSMEESRPRIAFVLAYGDVDFNRPKIRWHGGALTNSGNGAGFAYYFDSNRPGAALRARAGMAERIVQRLCVQAQGDRCGIKG
jgi:hypothetical protein